jgi:hypothetical protein
MFLVGDVAVLAARFWGGVVPTHAIMWVAVFVASLMAFGGVGAVLFGTLWLCSTPKEESKKVSESRKLSEKMGWKMLEPFRHK